MDYFNFEEASQIIPDFRLDDFESLNGEANEDDAGSCYESLFFDKSASLPTDPPTASAPTKLTLINNTDVEVVPHADDSNGVYPVFRAKEPCDLCRKMGLDCFLASRGTMTNGCTCCISLYRECSFTHVKGPKGFISIFPGISEDHMVCEGSIVEQKKAMRSFEDSRQRKTGARFPRDAVKILKQWLLEHAEHPYPNDREKTELKQLTGLKRSQISNWLANSRRRNKPRPISGPSSPILGAIDIPMNRQGCDSNDLEGLNPLDRWKASPPENEPASMTAIAKAVTAAPFPATNNSSQSSLHGSRASSRRTSSEEGSGLSMFKAPSISSFGTAQSSNSDRSFVSSRSQHSKDSFASSSERRRRRRAPMTQRVAAQSANSRSARIFQCTFCTDTFPSKYDWQRHEKSLHLALERWTCCPNGGTYEVPLTGCKHCALCQQPNPTVEHLEIHNFTACQEKTLQERTFYRKDHLRQHLKLLHGVKFDASMEIWKSTTNDIKSRCGFCPSVFSTWQHRVDHLAAHFRNGVDMSGWAGSWGFEPFVERLVENAMPPYLIGHERLTFNPYVAKSQTTPSSEGGPGLTAGSSVLSTDEDRINSDSNCWQRLEQELTQYINQGKASNAIPSDEELQNVSRKIIYDDEDPWNQTPADNKLWLDTLKYQAGIGTCPPDMVPKRLEEVPIMAPYVVRGGLKKSNAAAASNTRSVPGSSNPDFAPLPASNASCDMLMDIDFDQIDFSELNMGITNVDDIGDAGLGPLQTFDLDQPFLQQVSGTMFGSLNAPLGPQAQPKLGDGGMSVPDLSQLSGYMAEFH